MVKGNKKWWKINGREREKKKKGRIKRGSRFTRVSAYYAHISDDILNGASYYGVDRFAPSSAGTIGRWKKEGVEGKKDPAINPSSLFHRSCVLSTSPNAAVINEDILQEWRGRISPSWSYKIVQYTRCP